MPASNIQELDDSSFDSAITAAEKPVMVDFWAPWCGPCKHLTPILEQLADEMSDTVRIAKVNIDDSQGTAAKFGIQSIPTLLFFKDGQVADQVIGLRNKEELKAKIQNL